MSANNGKYFFSLVMILSLFCVPISAVTLSKQYTGSRARGMVKNLFVAGHGLQAAIGCGSLGKLIYDSLTGQRDIARQPPMVQRMIAAGGWAILNTYLARLIYRDACREFAAVGLADQEAAGGGLKPDAVTLIEEYSGSKVRGIAKGILAGGGACFALYCLYVSGGLYLQANPWRGHEAAIWDIFRPIALGAWALGGLYSAYLTRLIYRDACDELQAVALQEQEELYALMEQALEFEGESVEGNVDNGMSEMAFMDGV